MERTPIWGAGSGDWWDFTRSGRAKRGVGAMPVETRAADAYVENEAGGYVLRSPNTRLMAGKGMLTFPSRTQLFVSPSAPATQTITVANGTVYTVDVFGGGSVTLSDAGTGSASPGSSRTFTASGTSLTVTVSGSPTWVNVSAGAFGVQPLLAGTTGGPQQVIDIGSRAELGVGFIIDATVLETGSTVSRLIEFSETGSNVVNAQIVSGSNKLVFNVFSASVASVAMDVPTPAGATGRMVVAGVASANYAIARVVGQAKPVADTTVTFPTTLSKVKLLGRGLDALRNSYGYTNRLGLWYGPMSEHFFDNVLWPKAQLLAQQAA